MTTAPGPMNALLRSIVLSAEAVEQIRHTGAAAYPREACGCLLGVTDGGLVRVERVWTSDNMARNPDRAFELDPGSVVAAEDDARASGLELVGVWHSHPDAAAELSEADRVGLFAGWISVVGTFDRGRLAQLRAWRHVSGRWRESPVVSSPELVVRRSVAPPR